MFERLLAIACLLFSCHWVDAASAANPLGVPPWEKEWRKQIADALAKKVTADVDKKPLDEALGALRDQAGVTIIVDPAAIPAGKPLLISIKAANKPLADVLKLVMQQAVLEYGQYYGAIFIYSRAKLETDYLKPEDFLISKMLDGRVERLNYEMKDSPAGDAIKELTETPNITLPMDEKLKQNKVTVKFTDIGLGNALRWVVRLSGGKIVVDKENMRIVKR